MISVRDLKHTLTEKKVEQNNEQPPSALLRGPSPNRGASVPDVQAVGPDSEKKSVWLEKQGIKLDEQVKLHKLVHMRYQHPDLDEINTFLNDFGIHVVKQTDTQRWFAGYGPDPYVYYAQLGPKRFLGGAFEVQSHADLEKAIKISGVKILTQGIEEMDDAPGGGYLLTIEDPEGFPLNLVFGQKVAGHPTKHKEKIIYNDEIDKPRRRAFNRFQPGPAEVYKLGHFGLNVRNFPSQMTWYTTNFNLLPSDILYIPAPTPSSSSDAANISNSSTAQSRVPVAMFAHINLGPTLTDHHTMFLTTLDPTDPSAIQHVHHASFEVHDLDSQFLGHQWLSQKGYTPVWGVGRHILGSQIFDYWWDTTGFMVEHYTDGDLVNIDTPIGYGPAGHEGLAVWGPEVPKAFLE